MYTPLALALALALPACAAPEEADTGPSDASSLDPFAQAFVDAHNDARGRAEPTPEPALPDVGWDDDLAAFAQEWADACVFEHSTGDLGENLAAFSWEVEPADVVEGWFSEIEFYDYDANSCEAGQQCGHYTQVVWRDSTRIGCAVTACDLDGFGQGDFWVCEYDPPGNWVGERPY